MPYGRSGRVWKISPPPAFDPPPPLRHSDYVIPAHSYFTLFINTRAYWVHEADSEVRIYAGLVYVHDRLLVYIKPKSSKRMIRT